MATIDPDHIREIDTIDFNLLAEDLVSEFTRCITQLRGALTRGGIRCGECMTTYEDPHHPVVKLNVHLNFEEQVWIETSILIRKANCYIQAFKAEGVWRKCSNCTFDVIGAQLVDFSLSSRTSQVDKIGPGSIHKSLNMLNKSDKEKWRHGLVHLGFIFIESAKFIEVFTFVRGTFEKGSTNIYEYQDSPDALSAACPKHWGKLSKAFRRYFTPMNGVPSKWKLSASTIKALNIPNIQPQKATAAEILHHILSQIRRCEEMTCIILKEGA